MMRSLAGTAAAADGAAPGVLAEPLPVVGAAAVEPVFSLSLPAISAALA
jgi:hypothetical protein